MEEIRRFFARHASMQSHTKVTSQRLISGEEVGLCTEDHSTRIHLEVMQK